MLLNLHSPLRIHGVVLIYAQGQIYVYLYLTSDKSYMITDR